MRFSLLHFCLFEISIFQLFFNIFPLFQWDNKRNHSKKAESKPLFFSFSSHFKTWSENWDLMWNKCQFYFDILCKETKHLSVGKEEGRGRSHIFHQAPLRYLDHNTDVQFSEHNFEVKENSSCQSPLTLSAPSFDCSEWSNLFSSPHFQNSDKRNYWRWACARQQARAAAWELSSDLWGGPGGPVVIRVTKH